MSAPFLLRRRALLAKMSELGVTSLLVTNPKSWYYLTGFTGDAGVLLVSPRQSTLVTDGRFLAQANEETSGVRIVPQKGAALSTARSLLSAQTRGSIGFNPSEITVAQLRMLKTSKPRRLRWIAVEGLIDRLRERKDQQEISQMRKAAALAGAVLQRAIKLLKPGVRELEIAAEIDYQMRLSGASGPAFETIVAFGKRSAYPHARPTARRLGKNELVVLDLGAILGHYCSDITRTVCMGRAPQRVRHWYQAVLEAQSAATAAVKAGVTCEHVDAAARKVLAGYRLDRYFVHSTGHGLGLDVHEAPRIARAQKQTLTPGNVVTIEPGVYVPGIGGIRIEDDVAVYADGTEILTRVPRDLIEI